MALAIRIGWALLAPYYDPYLIEDPLEGDGIGYALLGWNLKNGDGFTWDTITPTSYRMPGYPILLSLVFTLDGLNLVAVRLLQALISALTILPVYGVAYFLAGNRVGLFAAAGVALYPLLIYMTGWIYSETLLLLLLWVGVFLLVKGFLQSRLTIGILAGIFFGLAALVRPEIALFPLPVFLWGAFSHWGRPRLWVAGASQIAIVAVLLPWSIRNTIVNHQFVPLTTSSGSNFYAGNNPAAHGGSAWTFPLSGKSEIESDRELAGRAIDWISQHPMAALGNTIQKGVKFFSPLSFETSNIPVSRWVWVVNVIFILFLTMAGWGAWKTWRLIPGAVLFLLVLWYLLMALVFYGGSRVALPVVPALIVFAAYTGHQLLMARQKSANPMQP